MIKRNMELKRGKIALVHTPQSTKNINETLLGSVIESKKKAERKQKKSEKRLKVKDVVLIAPIICRIW